MKFNYYLPCVIAIGIVEIVTLSSCNKDNSTLNTEKYNFHNDNNAWSGSVKKIYKISYADLKNKLDTTDKNDPFYNLTQPYPSELFVHAGYIKIKDTKLFYNWADGQLVIIASEYAHNVIQSAIGVEGVD